MAVTYNNAAFSSGTGTGNVDVAGTPYVPPPLLSLLANGVTIKYNGDPLVVTNSTARFILADPRGTGTAEWFAVVKNGMKSAMGAYASNDSNSSVPFTPPGQSSPVPFKNIVTTLMTDMSLLFYSRGGFNSDIESWDTSNVTNMYRMFENANPFNQPLNSWNTSNVTNMHEMFIGARSFNQPLNSWDTSKVTTMYGMFANAFAFNQPLNLWNTSNVTTMMIMFYEAKAFNQPLNSWDTSKVTTMDGMFSRAYVFNQPLNLWNTSAVTDMRNMFAGGPPDEARGGIGPTAFNQDISNWVVSLVTPAVNYSNFRFYSALTTNNTPPAFR
jgi:surface protein